MMPFLMVPLFTSRSNLAIGVSGRVSIDRFKTAMNLLFRILSDALSVFLSSSKALIMS
uniref:Uncharacterized protein n=1 Tax=Lepeophtheirus salmonis TaxID=72036 RepID=A0A0K2TVG4_LEPSM